MGTHENIDEIHVGLDLQGQDIPVGRMALIDGRIYFEYNDSFLENALNISPFSLALQRGAQVPEDNLFEGLFGVFDDSLPDGWGKLLIDRALREKGIPPERITPLDRLALVGKDGVGALTYAPDRSRSLFNNIKDEINLDAIHGQTQRIIQDEPDAIEALIRMGGSASGARPKISVQVAKDFKHIALNHTTAPDGFSPWMIKFAGKGDSHYIGNIEYAYSLMARAAGINMPTTHLFEGENGRSYFGIERFDRTEEGRLHTHTFCGLLHSDFRYPALDYDDLLKVTSALTRRMPDVEAAFRLACFNVLAHNRDDHGKNVSFVMDGHGEWRLAPAYDLTPSGGPGGEQSMSVMGEGRQPQEADLIALAKQHGVKYYGVILEQVADAISQWSSFADEALIPRRVADEVGRLHDKKTAGRILTRKSADQNGGLDP